MVVVPLPIAITITPALSVSLLPRRDCYPLSNQPHHALQRVRGAIPPLLHARRARCADLHPHPPAPLHIRNPPHHPEGTPVQVLGPQGPAGGALGDDKAAQGGARRAASRPGEVRAERQERRRPARARVRRPHEERKRRARREFVRDTPPGTAVPGDALAGGDGEPARTREGELLVPDQVHEGGPEPHGRRPDPAGDRAHERPG
mmetsp:Transcript_53687/g.114018  ORF Transcript_53687/g.114018 Transcript_53687/m.114018 type:complete len:204 (+) Transcript_53687:44-655(+)